MRYVSSRCFLYDTYGLFCILLLRLCQSYFTFGIAYYFYLNYCVDGYKYTILKSLFYIHHPVFSGVIRIAYSKINIRYVMYDVYCV
jgi:hypothetical protein